MALDWSPALDRALAVAARAHAGQTRKTDDTPYIAHPVAVALLVSAYTEDPDVPVAAVLHDVLEDVPPEIYDAALMERDFGPRVTSIVRGVSEDKTAGLEQAPWRERKDGYLAGLEEHSPECLLVSAADKVHNLRSLTAELDRLGAGMWSHFSVGPEDSLWFYRAVSEVVSRRLGADSPAARDLSAAVDALESRVHP